VTAGLLGGSSYPHLRGVSLTLEPCKVGTGQEQIQNCDSEWKVDESRSVEESRGARLKVVD
jgi:hypothetical protein